MFSAHDPHHSQLSQRIISALSSLPCVIQRNMCTEIYAACIWQIMACTDPSDGNLANKVEKRSKTRCKMETPNKAMQKTITTPIGKSGDRSHTVDGTMWWPTIARFFWYQQNCVPIDHHLWVWFLPYPVPLQDYLSSGVDISLVQRVQGPNK